MNLSRNIFSIFTASLLFTVFASAQGNVKYYYDGLGRLIAKEVWIDGQKIIQSYTYLGDTNQILLAKKGNGSVITYIDGNYENEHLAQVENGVGKTYITDSQGSVLNGVPGGASKSFGLMGEVNGNVQINSNSDPVMYGWQGMPYNAESGMWNNRARQYDPITGRFVGQDPSGIDGGLNLYGSRLNNPLKYFDPTGNGPLLAGLCVLGAAGTLVAGGVVHYGEAIDRRLALESALEKIDIQLSDKDCPNPKELKKKKDALLTMYRIDLGLQTAEGALQIGLLGTIGTYCSLALIAPTP